jgi:hypothetical protein
MGDLEPKVDSPALVTRILTPAAVAAVFAPHPIVGAFVASAIGQLIPERRIRRLEVFAEKLEEKLRATGVVPEQVPSLDDETLLLVGDATVSAARASSDERLDYIAHLLTNGLTSSASKKLDRRYLLRLLDELNDTEVLLLCAEGIVDNNRQREFVETHKEALQYEPAGFNDPPELVDRETIHESYEQHMVRVGVLEEHYSGSRQKPPEFDSNGKLKGLRTKVSSLGRMLLREIGHPSDFDRAE